MVSSENSSPNFLLIWDCSKAVKREEDSESILDLIDAALERFLAPGTSFLKVNSVSSSHKANLPHFKTSSKAPLERPMSSLVRTSATIFGCGVHLMIDFVLTISSWMMESSTAVRLSWRDDWLCLVRESKRLLASVMVHCCIKDFSSQSLRRIDRKGLKLLDQSSLQTSPKRTSRIMSWIHSSSPSAWPKASVSLAKVEETRRFSFDDLQERTETRIFPEAEGSLSLAIMIHAPWTLSDTGCPGGSVMGGMLSIPPASEAAIKTIWELSNLWRIKGDAVERKWEIDLFKQLTSWTVAWCSLDERMLTTPAHSGRVWWASQLTR